MAGERILIIDDGKENRDFIVEYVLQPNGFEPLIARDGLEGLEMAREHRPDLILLDLQMPRMNGMEVLDALNAEQLDIPVILMTFHGSEEIAIEVYRKGVRDYVKKPYTVEEMYDAINRSLTEVRLRHEKDQLTERLIAATAALNQRVRELNVLYNIGKTVTALVDIPTLMLRVAEAAMQLTSCEESSVFLVEGDELRCKAIFRQGEQRGYIVDEVRQDTLAMRAAESGQTVVLTEEEVQAARRSNPSAPTAGIATPLIIAGHSVGVLLVKNLGAGARLFTRHDGALLSALSDYAAIAYENAIAHNAAMTNGASDKQFGVKGALRRAVVTDVMDRLLAEPEVFDASGSRREISVLAARLHGYQAFALKAPPEQLVKLMNEYLSLASETIFAQRGTLDRLFSDGVMAIFNAPLEQPDHIYLAAKTALLLQKAVAAVNEKRGGGLSFCMGLHTGEAVVGYLGIEKATNFTAVGEAVDVARTVQEAARGGQILISQDFAQHVMDRANLNPIEAPLHGGLSVFELVGLRA